METKDLKELLEYLISFGKENEWIEFKSNIPDNSQEKIGQIISGLSNTANIHNKDFGYLVFGVDDKSLEIVGTRFDISKQKVGTNLLEHRISQRLNPKPDIRIHSFLYNNKPIVIFEIPKAINKPIEFINIAYIRIDSITRKLSDFDEKERKIWLNTSDYKFENQIAKERVSLEEVTALLDYFSYYKLTGENIPESKTSIIQRFEQEGFIIKDSKGGFKITNLGAILFANNLSNFTTTRRKGIRVVQYKGKDKTTTLKSQDGGRGYASGFQHLIRYITTLIPGEEVIKDGLRESTSIPHDIIREIVANAIIHQDFIQTGTGPTIDLYSDRIEITNPGKPLISIDRLLDHPPKSRNEDLAGFMRRINICEERGSGIDKVIVLCEKNNLIAPQFQSEEEYTKVTIFYKSSLSRLNEGERMQIIYWHACLRFFTKDFMTNESIRKRFNIEEQNYSSASRIIKSALDKGIIKIYDNDSKSKKFTKYIPFWA